MIARRIGDGAAGVDPKTGTEYVPGQAAGVWRQGPIGQAPIAMGATWGSVTPFVLRSGKHFANAFVPSRR
jgi:hypothetical protein